MNGIESLTDDLGESKITLRNRLYYDGPRSRFFDNSYCYVFSFFPSKYVARQWCEANGFEFIDNTLQRIPEELRLMVLRARRAGQSAAPRRSARHFRLSDYQTNQRVSRSGEVLNNAFAYLLEGAI